MTKKIITSYTAFLCLTLLLALATTVQASEVTGTLSSAANSNTQASGSISGTVSSDSSGNGGSSRSGSRGNRGSSLANAPSSAVLGASTSSTPTTPGFPNAGFAPEEIPTPVTLWSTVITFLRNIISY